MELNFRVMGSGDPVIILHGLFGSLDNWVSFGRNLGEHYTVYLIDQRDHGRSPHTEEFDFDILARDIYEFMQANWIFSAHIIGHSMGGKTAMKLALMEPDMVESLVVLDIAPKEYQPRHTRVFEAIRSLDLGTVKSRKEVMNIMVSTLDVATSAFLAKNIKRNNDGSFEWKMNVELLMANYDKISSGIGGDTAFEGKCLFVQAENSSYISEEDFPLIRSLFPMADIELLEGAGHWLHVEKPKILLELLLKFFESMAAKPN